MAKKRTVNITWDAKVEKFKRKLKEVVSLSERSNERMQKSASMLSKSSERLAVAAVSGAFLGYKAFSFMKNSIELAANQEAAEKKLEIAYGKNILALKEYASMLQSKTAFGDEEIIEAQALIAAFTKEEDQIKRLTKASMDLAVAKGMDLKSAADLVSKTIGSSTNALSRYGIAVEGALGSTERFESLLSGVNDKFGGQAEGQLDTYAGKVKQLDNYWGDFQETIGNEVIPTMNALIPKITEAIKAISGTPKTDQEKIFDLNEIIQGESNSLSSRINRIGMYGLEWGQIERLGKDLAFMRDSTIDLEEKEARLKNVISAVNAKYLQMNERQKAGHDTENIEKMITFYKVEQDLFSEIISSYKQIDKIKNSINENSSSNHTTTTTQKTNNIPSKIVKPDFLNEQFENQQISNEMEKMISDEYELWARQQEILNNRLESEELISGLRIETLERAYELEKRNFNMMLNGASELGYSLETAFSGHGETLLAKMNQAFQIALRMASAFETASSNNWNTGSSLGLASSVVPGLGFLEGLFKAEGGRVNAGQSYVVGEQGMEVFTPSSNGYITPNDRINISPSSRNSNNNPNDEMLGRLDVQNYLIENLIEATNRGMQNTKLEASVSNNNIYLSNKKAALFVTRYSGTT